MFSPHMSMRLRQLGPVGALLVLSVVGFFLARALGESNARRDSDRRAEIAAIRVRDRIVQATTLVDGVRRLLVSEPTALTPAEFVQVGALWLAPSGLPAAGWVERVPAAGRAAYERRIDHPIVMPSPTGAVVPAGARRTYYPATFVTHSPPMSTEGIDLGGIAAVVKAIARPQTAFQASATPLLRLSDGTTGLFLVQSAQRVDRQLFRARLRGRLRSGVVAARGGYRYRRRQRVCTPADADQGGRSVGGRSARRGAVAQPVHRGRGSVRGPGPSRRRPRCRRGAPLDRARRRPAACRARVGGGRVRVATGEGEGRARPALHPHPGPDRRRRL